MKAFVCVYLHYEPSKKAKTLTQAAAVTDPNLRQFLADYDRPNAFWDWGDDPGFYSASRILDSPLKASWGVCRRDVRIQIDSGDFIVWFCARRDANTKAVNYYFVGCTTVAETIDRITLWTGRKYRAYRDFYNTLARPSGDLLVQHEIIHPFHADWARRATAPYILFDDDSSLSAVNLCNPTLVATKNVGNWQETWLSASDQQVANLEDALFDSLGITRRLRTSHPRQPHRHVPLHHAPVMTNLNRNGLLEKLRETILPMV